MSTRGERILQGGRAKAYRPLPMEQRRRALRDGLDAYDRGDFFLAHELLEPAWMGTNDVAERELIQGVIKVAAAYVHAVRGNPAGVAKNLRGALARLEAGAAAGDLVGIDSASLISDVRARLGSGGGTLPGIDPAAEAPPRIRRAG